MKKKIAIFSGAGLDRESGVLTFRDCEDGLWENYSIDEVATPQGWKKDPQKVLDFYNARRAQMPTVVPNRAHEVIVEMENDYEVTNITQNVSDLLERAGATTVYHLHGDLTKARGDKQVSSPFGLSCEVYHIGYDDIKLGDLAKDDNSQMRPHIVWFGEYPFQVNESYDAIADCDVLIIVGTSLNIYYTLDMLASVKTTAKVYYVDPQPSKDLDSYGVNIEYVEKIASEGMEYVLDEIRKMDSEVKTEETKSEDNG